MPNTSAITMASPHSMIEPVMALRSPPREPAGGVSMVKVSAERPATPLAISVQSTAARNIRAIAVTR
jgi:hypothetical protein